MKLLALDTSTLACSVGALRDGRVFAVHEQRPREHSKILLPMVKDVLERAELNIVDLDAVILGNGPGSFIGVRIAASVSQGLAYAAGVDIVPVSSMAAVAVAAGRPGDIVAVSQDAHLEQVYLGIYRIDDCGRPEELIAERLQAQEEIVELRNHSIVIAAGQGWHRYPALLETNVQRFQSISDARYPTAESLLALGKVRYAAGDLLRPELVDPAYLRDTVAAKPQP